MTYIDLINEFWKQNGFKSFQALDAKFYFYLLNECNKREWLNPFELQSRCIELEFGITRKTIGEVRGRLKARGLIDFDQRSKLPTLYLIENVNVSQKAIQMFTGRNISETFKKHLGNISVNISETYNKDLRIKTKENPLKGVKESPHAGDVPENPTESLPENSVESSESPESAAYVAFLDWVKANAPYVHSHLQPLTQTEFARLKARFGSKAIAETVANIENRKDLRKKYTNLYRTILNWCKRETDN